MPNMHWQDNEIRFDVSSSLLNMVPGECVLERVELVEDTKANSGEPGCLIMTNLRLLWYSHKTAKLNLTIGYNTLVSVTSQPSNNKSKRNSANTLHILTKIGNEKFEFLFTPLNENKKDFSAILNEIHKSYCVSKPFRELRLRHHIIQANQLKVMPLEHICNRIDGVWNLANNQGNLGCFIITNVRVVWFASLNEYFNISLPYLQIAQFSVRDSKFGQVLVIESVDNSGGGYVLGFRIDPASRLKQIIQELRSLHVTQNRNPEFGVIWKSTLEDQAKTSMPLPPKDEKQDQGVRCFANYLQPDCFNSISGDHPPEFDKSIGLAMEKLPKGVNRNSLWKITF
ncbi:hypothetical protein OUZ56_013315 [Daphnia magna]|uniref:BBSome complex member BBS5 PH domain-containing protein n=1 Tax=Daphnia magna TaxID=35525 RepID=A0ABQ9Z5I5_9CRUS|nr:hypothetical protein OUZ56_013315 [Daphnia magna]